LVANSTAAFFFSASLAFFAAFLSASALSFASFASASALALVSAEAILSASS